MDISEAGGSPASFSISRGIMISINSPDNITIKDAAKLSVKKYRDEQACYIAEGPNIIREAIEQEIALRALFFVDSKTIPDSRKSELRQLTTKAAEIGVITYLLRADAFSRIAQTDTSQGVAAIVEKRKYTEEEFFKKKGGNILVLDRVQDPGNIGTLLRTAEAAGLSGVMLLKGCGDVYSPKTVRAAAGTLFRLPLLFADTPSEAIRILRKNEKRIYATAAAADTVYFDCSLSKDAAIIIGNEGNGVADEFLQKADCLLSIPMEGHTESLNAALAGGIIMYEALRQRLSETL